MTSTDDYAKMYYQAASWGENRRSASPAKLMRWPAESVEHGNASPGASNSHWGEALHLEADLAEVLRALGGGELALVLGVAGVRRDLEELRRLHPRQAAVLVDLHPGEDVTRGRVEATSQSSAHGAPRKPISRSPVYGDMHRQPATKVGQGS